MLDRTAKRENTAAFLKTLEQSNALLNVFNEELCNAMVDSMTVYSDHRMNFTFKDESKLVWKM